MIQDLFLQEMSEEALNKILRIVRRMAAMADQGVIGVPSTSGTAFPASREACSETPSVAASTMLQWVDGNTWAGVSAKYIEEFILDHILPFGAPSAIPLSSGAGP